MGTLGTKIFAHNIESFLFLFEGLGIEFSGGGRLAASVLGLLRMAPMVLVLDGLEVVQEGPEGNGFGRLLNGTLREVLSGACRLRHSGLVMLTSRFPFADLEAFEGSSVRFLEVPPFTLAEGAVAHVPQQRHLRLEGLGLVGREHDPA